MQFLLETHFNLWGEEITNQAIDSESAKHDCPNQTELGLPGGTYTMTVSYNQHGYFNLEILSNHLSCIWFVQQIQVQFYCVMKSSDNMFK